MKPLFVVFLLFSFQIHVAAQSNTAFKSTKRDSVHITQRNFNYKKIDGSKKRQKSSLSQAIDSLSWTTARGIDTLPTVRLSLGASSPHFIERRRPTLKSTMSDTARCYQFLQSVQSVMKVENPRESFVLTSIKKDSMGNTRVRMHQLFKGIRVEGADFYVHLKKDKDQLTGSFSPVYSADTEANITSEEAIRLTIEEFRSARKFRELSADQSSLLNYDGPSASLLLRKTNKHSHTLVYKVTIRPNFFEEWICFVDAKNGKIVEKRNNTKSESASTATATDLLGIHRTINTTYDDGLYFMANISEDMYNPETEEGYIITLDAQNTSAYTMDYAPISSTNNKWNSPVAVSAHFNTAMVYRAFSDKLGRSSINGSGGSITSFINVAEEDGSSMENAFWNGQFAFYGNGGDNFKPLAGGLDVIAHELGHGIVSTTANLDYVGQSGAINESYADIFASLVDDKNWTIGEDVVKPSFAPSGCLRNMSNPHNGADSSDYFWQPRHTKEMYTGDDDGGGVHVNSGICNYAYFLYANKTSVSKAQKVFYLALTDYLTSSSKFAELRMAVVQAAGDIFGTNATEVLAAGEAFDSVGIFETDSMLMARGNQQFDVNPGDVMMCYYNTDPSKSHTFYSSDIFGEDAVGLSKKESRSRMSISDDGSYGVFVASNGNIIGIDFASKKEFVLQDDTVWSDIALSKDGKRMAAVTNQDDRSIWVYDFVGDEWRQFLLYNPTTGHTGQESGGVLYSDAMDFDVTGQQLVYDAYNEIKSKNGSKISYWDIGIINVWSNKDSCFGTGHIKKLFGSMPTDVSIGNPTFSKRSPHVIAFDFFDQRYSSFFVLATNTNTGDLDLLAENNTLGFPSYTKDDSVVVFTSRLGKKDQVCGVLVLANKISAGSDPVLLIDNARWGVCYATGVRLLGLKPVARFSSNQKIGKPNEEITFFDNSLNEPSWRLWTFDGGTPKTSDETNPTVSYAKGGTYSVTLKVVNPFGIDSLLLMSYITIVGDSSATIDTSHAKNLANETFNGTPVYPCPASKTIHLSERYEKTKVSILDVSGRLVLSSLVKEGAIDVSCVEPGMYILLTRDGFGKFWKR